MTVLRRKWLLGHTHLEASNNQIAPEPIMGSVLFYTLISDQREMMESTLSKFEITSNWGTS